MPQTELDPLKQELFAYLESLPEETRTLLRTRTTVSEAGFDTHLNELYGGSWIRATEDFQFYQFVKTAQRYQRAKSPSYKQGLEKRLVRYAFDITGTVEEKLLFAIFGEKIEDYSTLLEAIKGYITRNPPVYDENYKSGLKALKPEVRPVLQDFTQETAMPPTDAPSYRLLKDQVNEVLSTLNDRERTVLQLRFGLEDGKSRTLVEAGRELPNYKTGGTGVTEARVRQIERTALRKLRHPSRSRKLKDFLE